ncbi:MAG: Anthranilate synthase component 1 [Phycisphaerae bacterium]|nr:Anthranilate synthase component 1 [Phycisphaerae bacterium]
MLLSPDFQSFSTLAAGHDRVPVWASLVCDDLTPVSAFLRLSGGAAHAFLLESVVGGEKIARYSFLGCSPATTFSAYGRDVRIEHAHSAVAPAALAHDDPLRLLEEQLGRQRRAQVPGLPRFTGGAVGYAAYDAVRYFERLASAPRDDRGLPDLLFGIYETMIIFDHVRKLVLVVAHADTTSDPRRAYDQAAAEIASIVERLAQPAALNPVALSLPVPPLDRYQSNFSRSEFERAVEHSKEYIRAGDIFQVVLSQRLEVETRAAPFDIYRALRVINPSPFMFFLQSPQVVLVGASPEIMCRVEDGVVTNRPLAGTRPRGRSDEEDRALREELLADPKERAEHVMLVDLGRNDVGRVCQPGSVRISDVMSIEYYSHVMHLCSNVTGRLASGRTAFDALRAALPVGTVSGAPKVRAMEVIDELEPTRRGPYAGAVGYVDFAGNMDTCIALRTIVIQPHLPSQVGSSVPPPADSPSAPPAAQTGPHRAFVQVGAGIVADSVPSREYDETISKAQGMLTAIRAAEEHFRSASDVPISEPHR